MDAQIIQTVNGQDGKNHKKTLDKIDSERIKICLGLGFTL